MHIISAIFQAGVITEGTGTIGRQDDYSEEDVFHMIEMVI
jgi:hypothetical protein